MRYKRRGKNSFPNGYRTKSQDRHDYEPEAQLFEYAARLKEIPPDERTPCQRLMGDPEPWRSALGKRQSMWKSAE